MTFAFPLLLLLIIPFIAIIIYAWRQPFPALKIPAIENFVKSSKKHISFRISLILYTIVGILMIIAIARPREGTEYILHNSQGIDIVIAVDLSGSMRAMDVPEQIESTDALSAAIAIGQVKTRLEVAKEEIDKFIKKRKFDRIGLIAFAPLPYVVCPPTLDHNWLKGHLETLKPGMIGDATGIAGPIASAVQRLKESESKRKILVLFTDGSNNVEAQITPLQAATLAKDFGITIYCVGIGSDNAYVAQDSLFGKRFTPFPGGFDEDLLKEMSKLTDGKYYKAKDAKSLETAMKEIDKMEKITMKQPKFIDYKELSPKLLLIALIIAGCAFILDKTILLRIP